MEIQGPSSYRCSNVDSAVDYLVTAGYRFAQPRSTYEKARLTMGRSLIVVYNNGTLLLQGGDTDSPRELLSKYTPSQASLPF